MSNLNLYQTPSNEILRHRRAFYDLWKRCDDECTTWLSRVQKQIIRCEFPLILSPEYLLIDKFVCELDDDERTLIQSIDTWTLMDLKDFADQQMRAQTVAVACEFDGYEYSENITSIEIADEAVALKSEPNATGDDFFSTESFSDDDEAGYISIELDSDTMNEILVNDMDCDDVNYKFAISNVTSIAETDDANEKRSVHPAKRQSAKQNSRKRKTANECNECKKIFRTPYILKAHKKIVHQGIRPHKCRTCDEYFASADELKRHACTQTEDKQFACDQCEKAFISAYSLECHRRAGHRRIGPFTCDICDKICSTFTLIRRHMIRHMGEQPYQCDQCNRTFARKSYMKIHKLRIHQRFHSYRCPDCDKSFINSYELNRHILSHSGVKKFACQYCEKRFYTISNLKIHMRRLHK